MSGRRSFFVVCGRRSRSWGSRPATKNDGLPHETDVAWQTIVFCRLPAAQPLLGQQAGHKITMACPTEQL